MTEISSKIFDVLSRAPGIMTEKALASAVGMRDARSLRAHGKDPGILHMAAEEIFREKRLVLLSFMRPPGIKLSRALAEIEQAQKQWIDWLWSIKKQKIDVYDRAINELASNELSFSFKEENNG